MIRLIALLLFISLSTGLKGHSWSNLLNVELIEQSDLVVQGQVIKKDSLYYISIADLLQGDVNEEVEIIRPNGYPLGIKLEENQEGIFFLRKVRKENKYGFFHPNCVQNTNQRSAVDTAFDIWNQPERYVHGFEAEGEQVNYVLGQLFSGWRVTCQEVPILDTLLSNRYLDTYSKANWARRGIDTINVKITSADSILIESTIADPELKYLFEKRIEWFAAKEKIVSGNELTIIIDNSIRDHANLPYEAASNYLKDKLESKEIRIVRSAIKALSSMADTSCISALMSLVNASSLAVAKTAISALGWSKSPAGINLIGAILMEKSNGYPENHRMLNIAALALQNINRSECLPYLTYAAQHGVERAFYALGMIGDENSFEALMMMLSNNTERCYEAVNPLQLLVERSNYKLEDWMRRPSRDNIPRQRESIPRWLAWYETVGDDFSITKSLLEVLRERR
ncbi:MAG: HEAT repeat domain-containing protein [Bacteroidota bacterium]